MSACLVGTVTRSLLTLPTLSIGDDDDPIQFNGANDAADAASWRGDRWDLAYASSPWVHGEHLVAARRTNSEVSLRLWVIDTSHAAIKTAYVALRDAVGQWTYGLTLTFDATSYVYTCHPGDISIGFTRSHGRDLWAPVQVLIPVMPSY